MGEDSLVRAREDAIPQERRVYRYTLEFVQMVTVKRHDPETRITTREEEERAVARIRAYATMTQYDTVITPLGHRLCWWYRAAGFRTVRSGALPAFPEPDFELPAKRLTTFEQKIIALHPPEPMTARPLIVMA